MKAMERCKNMLGNPTPYQANKNKSLKIEHADSRFVSKQKPELPGVGLGG